MRIRNSKVLQGGLLLLIIGCVFLFFENQKKYTQTDFSKRYFDNQTKEVSLFEIGDGWRGNFSYDTERAVEGKTSMTLTSWYGKESAVELTKTIPLDGYTKGYILVFVKNKDELRMIKNMYLELSDNLKHKLTIPLEKNLTAGWNRVPFVVPAWKNIEHVKLGIVSAAQTIAEVNVDRLWIENTDSYTKDLITEKPKWLSLRTIGQRTYLYSFSPSPASYILADPQFLRSGTITASLIPERSKSITFGLNGTRIVIAGTDMKTCNAYAGNNAIVRKILTKTSAMNDFYVFLRATVKGDTITYDVSNNGIDYEQCASLKRGGKTRVELTLDGSYLVDGVQAEYVQ